MWEEEEAGGEKEDFAHEEAKTDKFKRFYLFIFQREGKGEREGEKYQCARETLIGCLSHAPNLGPKSQILKRPYQLTGGL